VLVGLGVFVSCEVPVFVLMLPNDLRSDPCGRVDKIAETDPSSRLYNYLPI
jgi:hypothetical protein